MKPLRSVMYLSSVKRASSRREITSPDGWTCVLTVHPDGTFSPVEWRDAAGFSRESCSPSAGLREFAFPSVDAAIGAAYRERMNRDYLRHGG